jgi:hypothetical protein
VKRTHFRLGPSESRRPPPTSKPALSLLASSTPMPSSKPQERLFQVAGQLALPQKPLATRFRPKLPPHLPASCTPLNPISFLLKAATIRPDHIALVHPEKRLQWTFSEW